MADREVVNQFFDDLTKLASVLDQSLENLFICFVFQKRPALNPGKWILCVCADGLDDMSELAALSFVLSKLEATCDVETQALIERVSVLHAYEPSTDDLLADLQSVRDGAYLRGRSVLGRIVGTARILWLGSLQQLGLRQSPVAATL